MAVVALAAMVVLVTPVFGLEHIIVTKPILFGALAYIAGRRWLNTRDSVLSVALAPITWVTVSVLVDAETGIDMSGKYRFVVWLVFTGMVMVAVSIGATLAGRKRFT